MILSFGFNLEIVQWFHWERCSLEEFYPVIAIVSLMHIIHDPNLAMHHTNVVQALMFIFQSLGTKSIPYLDQVVPSFLLVIKRAEAGFKEFLFQQLGVLISIVRHHIKPYLKDIFQLVKVCMMFVLILKISLNKSYFNS